MRRCVLSHELLTKPNIASRCFALHWMLSTEKHCDWIFLQLFHIEPYGIFLYAKNLQIPSQMITKTQNYTGFFIANEFSRNIYNGTFSIISFKFECVYKNEFNVRCAIHWQRRFSASVQMNICNRRLFFASSIGKKKAKSQRFYSRLIINFLTSK